MVTFATETPMRLKQVAEHFGVNRRTVEAWIRQGLKAKRIGKLIYTTLEEVDRFSQPVVVAGCDGATTETDIQKEAREAIERLRSRGYKV